METSTNELMQSLAQELLAAQHVLDTQYSFELAEPNYRRCLAIIDGLRNHQSLVEDLLVDLLDRRAVDSEPIAYLMHVLRWPRLRVLLEETMRCDPDAIATRVPEARVVDAYSPDWQNREFYGFL